MVLRTVLKPSFLIIHGITVHGGTHYVRHEIEESTHGENGTRKKWETEKVIYDKAEHDEAIALAGRLKTQFRKGTQSAQSDAGLICPRENEHLFDETERAIREQAAEFNAKSNYTKIEVRPLVFEIHADDIRTLEAIASNISDTLRQLEEAMTAGCIKDVRRIVGNLVGLDQVLPEGRGEAIKNLIENVRKQSRQVVKAAKDAGKKIDEVQERLNTAPLHAARFAIFSDSEDDTQGEVEQVEAISPVNAQRFATIEEEEPVAAVENNPVDAPANEEGGSLVCLTAKRECEHCRMDEGDQTCIIDGEVRFTEFMKACPAA